jgi:patatin-like phospholipase/acyl hydrolase
MPNNYKILTLDGGGAKGFYTLGILKEIEALCGTPLAEQFSLIYGTSTGAIIAALLGLGYKVDDIHILYKKHVPAVMKCRGAASKSAALKKLVEIVFGTKTFADFLTNIGIVATQWDLEKPMIFKTDVQQAPGRQSTFVPGFGCKIAEAVEASCSAYPFFERPKLKTSKGDVVELMDGGYCANNPSLYAIADGVVGLKKAPEDLRVVSLGVGTYPEPAYAGLDKWLRKLTSVQLLQKTLNVNTHSMEQLRQVLYSHVDLTPLNSTIG